MVTLTNGVVTVGVPDGTADDMLAAGWQLTDPPKPKRATKKAE